MLIATYLHLPIKSPPFYSSPFILLMSKFTSFYAVYLLTIIVAVVVNTFFFNLYTIVNLRHHFQIE